MTETGVETSYVSLFYGNPRNASHPKTVKTAISCEWSSEIRISGGNKKREGEDKDGCRKSQIPPRNASSSSSSSITFFKDKNKKKSLFLEDMQDNKMSSFFLQMLFHSLLLFWS